MTRAVSALEYNLCLNFMSEESPDASTTATPASQILATRLAAAAELRNQRAPVPEKTTAQLAAEHDKRQFFRRMVDPGILRPNSKPIAQAALKVLCLLTASPLTNLTDRCTT